MKDIFRGKDPYLGNQILKKGKKQIIRGRAYHDGHNLKKKIHSPFPVTKGQVDAHNLNSFAPGKKKKKGKTKALFGHKLD